jgi:integrase
LCGECPITALYIGVRSIVEIFRIRDRPEKGRASETIRIDSFLKKPWAKFKQIRATPSVFSHYRDYRLKEVQPATVSRDLGLLRAIFEVARLEWDIPLANNPLAGVRKPRKPSSRERRLEDGELELLLRALWSDVTFCNSILLVREAKTVIPDAFHFGVGL